jgi:hypothetical protein
VKERIEELFGQALDEVVSETWSKLTPGQVVKLTDKFAELLLEDVLNIVGNGGEFASRPKLVEQIKAHFEIEE